MEDVETGRNNNLVNDESFSQRNPQDVKRTPNRTPRARTPKTAEAIILQKKEGNAIGSILPIAGLEWSPHPLSTDALPPQ